MRIDVKFREAAWGSLLIEQRREEDKRQEKGLRKGWLNRKKWGSKKSASYSLSACAIGWKISHKHGVWKCHSGLNRAVRKYQSYMNSDEHCTHVCVS